MRRTCLQCTVYFVALLVPCGVAQPSPPNIVLIMADDLGYETLGCYGGTSYSTPHLDAMAANGVRFDHAYATPLCTNTRVQLMTGKYNNRNWQAFGILSPKETTFGHLLQRAGYKTCIAGKWQLRSYDPPDYPGANLRRNSGMHPRDAGFDEYCLWHTGHTESKGSRYANPHIDRNGQIIPNTDGQYGPDVWTDYLIDFIERHQNDSFFVYFPMALPHNPFVPTPASDAWKRPALRQQEDVKFAKDMIEYTDTLVGRILQQLDKLKLTHKTVILFYSDNGTNQKIRSKLGKRVVRGGKGLPTDLGMRVPLIAAGAVQGKGRVIENLVDSTDFLPTLTEIVGAPNPRDTDGHSFWPQLSGRNDEPRKWVYLDHDPRPGWDKDRFHLIRFCRDKRFKLYEDGRLIDVVADPLEESPIMPSADTNAQANLRLRLQEVLNSMDATVRYAPEDVPRPTLDDVFAVRDAFHDQGGYLIAELESSLVPRDESWRQESSIPGYTGIGYLRSLRTQSDPAQRGTITIPIQISTRGRWLIQLRHRRDHSQASQADCWLQLDDGPWIQCRSDSPIGRWSWDMTANGNHAPLEFNLREDQHHRIKIAPASAHLKIDRIAVFQVDRQKACLSREYASGRIEPVVGADLVAAAIGQSVPQFGRQFVLFRGDRVTKLFLKRATDVEFLADRLTQLDQPSHQFVFLKVLVGFKFPEKPLHPAETLIDLFNRQFGVLVFQSHQSGGLNAVEHHEGTVLFVSHRPGFIGRMLSAKVHQSQRMIGIPLRPFKLANRQPTNASMVELNELAIGLGTLVLVHRHVI